jgi:tRNA pseudouridine13 synthase
MTEPLAPDWPRATTPPLGAASLRAQPEDFVVEEQMPFTLSGAGEHVWLKVRKRALNTEQVAGTLARLAGVPRRGVGYAGMKDRHAVTVQWFSVHLPGREAPDWAGGLPGGIELLAQTRHARKLQTGAAAGNAFTIVLRDCAGDREALARRLVRIRREGVPNYFGEQRFGRGGENVVRARAMFGGERVASRHLRGICLSAARAWLFNAVLARRVAAGNWNRALEGEAFVLNGTRSFFVADAHDEEIARRLTGGDIHPSGPLWGRGELPARAAARELEETVAAGTADLARGLEAEGLEQERRALRLFPRDLEVEWLDGAALRLQFALPAGAFATAVLRELAVYKDVAGVTPEA